MLKRVKIVAVVVALLIAGGFAAVTFWPTSPTSVRVESPAPVVVHRNVAAPEPSPTASVGSGPPPSTVAVVSPAPVVEQDTPDPVPSPTPSVGSGPPPAPVVEEVTSDYCPSPTPTDDPQGERQEVSRSLLLDPLYLYPATLEEMVIKADIIARVRLRSVNPAGARSDPSYTSDDPIPEGVYIGSLAYRLDVLEYLKGEISTTTITAYAYGWNTIDHLHATTTVAGARQLGRDLLNTRDTRWDDREAIVLLRYNATEQHHYLGLVGVERGAGYWDFTVASPMWKSWLPDAADPTSSLDPRQSTPGPQRFLLDDPADYPTSSAVPTATLASLRETVQRLLRELAAGDGSQAYRECVVYKYELHSRAVGSVPHDPKPVEMLSGMPAGTRVLETPLTSGSEAGRFSEFDHSFWTDGPDRDVLLGVWPSVITTARPLPSGEYNAWLRVLSAKERICGDPVPKAWRKIHGVLLKVTSPAGTLAESFFDPYVDGAAVTGTTTVGMIKWQPPSAGSGPTGRVTADLDIDATGHALHFIALDGTTTLSLVVADATRTDGTLSWSVPIQPWSPGDKLMLRVRQITP